ncbi:uncharacterized protein RJT20DRAFT_32018 [Scheffersomyces xylosifermentans]|uniref:uncharacterized protein n=1 Tax=Scheffersomyces xylosifermentans TaxID=1304137 RepID=UPI00315C6AF9
MPCEGECSCSKKGTTDVQISSSANKDSNDDVWDEDRSVSSNADIQRSHEKQGYLDGLSHAKESSLQAGFDTAFPSGAQLGIAVGKILGKLRSHNDEALFIQGKQELNIGKIMDKKYFNDELELAGEHEIISKWQKIVENLK